MEQATAETILYYYGLIEIQLWHCDVHVWYNPKPALSLFSTPQGSNHHKHPQVSAAAHKATPALHTKQGWGQNSHTAYLKWRHLRSFSMMSSSDILVFFFCLSPALEALSAQVSPAGAGMGSMTERV